MYRGTTPTLTIKLNSTGIDFDDIEQAWITLRAGTVSKTFNKDRIIFNETNGTLQVELTQKDTLAFPPGKVAVQLRILMDGGISYASQIKTIDMNPILKEGEITNGQ